MEEKSRLWLDLRLRLSWKHVHWGHGSWPGDSAPTLQGGVGYYYYASDVSRVAARHWSEFSIHLKLNMAHRVAQNFVWVPLGIYLGRRPVFVLTALVFFVCQIWGALATNFISLRASLVVSGFMGSSTEALGAALVNVSGLRIMESS